MEYLVLYLYIFLLLILVIFQIGDLRLFYLSRKNNLKFKDSLPKSIEIKDLPLITLQLPIYNEGLLVERLLDYVSNLNYPAEKLQVQLLDDSDDGSAFSNNSLFSSHNISKFNTEYIHRENRSGYKAGALKNGLNTATGEYIAILDVDFKPQPNFLNELLHDFTSPDICCVQARWSYTKELNKVQQVQKILLDKHFYREQSARQIGEYFLTFNGSGGIWKKQAILDSGNWETETLTEDLDLSIRAQLHGYRIKYLNSYSIENDIPANIAAFQTQQFRWCKGTLQNFVKHGELRKDSKGNKLGVGKLLMLQHLLASNFQYPVLLALTILFPILMLSFGEISESISQLTEIFFISTMLLGFSSALYISFSSSEKRLSKMLLYPRLIATVIGLSVQNTIATYEAITNKKTPFIRTDKSVNLLKNKEIVLSIKQKCIIYINLLIAMYLLFMSVLLFINKNYSPLIFTAICIWGYFESTRHWLRYIIRNVFQFTPNSKGRLYPDIS